MRDFDVGMLDVPVTQKTRFSVTMKNAQMNQWRKEVVTRG
jgi:hypothetical protein